MKTSLHVLLLVVATACSTEYPRQQGFADTASVRRVTTERPPAVDTLTEPSIAEDPPSVYRPPRDTRRSSPPSRVYHEGPRGGCYTYTASGRKRYVDHSFCG